MGLLFFRRGNTAQRFFASLFLPMMQLQWGRARGGGNAVTRFGSALPAKPVPNWDSKHRLEGENLLPKQEVGSTKGQEFVLNQENLKAI
jgi:hypothetical protein